MCKNAFRFICTVPFIMCTCNFELYVFGSIHIRVISMYTAISRKAVGKNVHATIPKGNMGYDQYAVPGTVAVESTFVPFLWHSQTYIHGLSCHSFKFL